jgi:hypothetical protein
MQSGATFMQNKILIIFFFVFLEKSALGQPKEMAMSKEQIVKMIPRSHDLLDPQERDNLLQLIAAVDSIYPVLCEELLSTENPRTQAYILAILGKAEKNKDLVLPSVRKYMNRHKDDDPQPDTIFTGIKTLGEIGGSEDVKLLAHFSDSGDDVNRVVAAQSIKLIRTRERTQERDSAPSKRQSTRGEASNSNDVGLGPENTVSKGNSVRSLSKEWIAWVSLAVVLVGMIRLLKLKVIKRR